MSIRRLAPALLLVLAACAKSTPGPEAAAPAAPAPKTLAKTTPPPVDEPLAPPVVQSDAPPPVAVAPTPVPDEPLAPPVDTRSADPLVAKGSMWGDAGMDKKGSGGLGLSGIGEGGGGRGEGIGLGSIGVIGRGAGVGSGAGFGSGHGRLGGSHRGPAGVRVGPGGLGASAQSQGGVRTGEWDDNANYREYARWLGKERAPGAATIDLSARRFLVVRDSAGKPVPSCPIEVRDSAGTTLSLRTTANGRALLFPRTEGLKGPDLVATARCQGESVAKTTTVVPGDGVVDLVLSGTRVLPEAQTIDVAFVLDTTGSMSEEIHALRDTLEKVAGALSKMNVRPRVGLVEYRDRGDEYVTRMHQMTTDVTGLQARIATISAGGGGDTPEHVNEALRVAVRNLRFRPESLARLVFLIGDAPPHLDYAQDEGYAGAMKEASHAGVQVYSIAASGMDTLGQVVFRQIAQYTGGTHMFVLRGGAGPESVGGGDPRASCGGTHTDYTSGNLDALILGKVQGAIAARDADPMRIAGLNQDEKDRPCDQRIVMAR
ncbi:vWA domain-containing protein [Polyangium mundeleinium]|uniref:VWA domain-containing protein n=1 Tax=Polyangium mundeleinium TaxID=2995306 RepID=A0ABT5F670_9BACT|nr:vWA domain-containing protein [Polyangium mundeleinium]MDC0749603.1 VWA domain-containing protein [Polyangium mundeleinium]